MGVVWALATSTMGEAIRRRVLLIILLVALGFLIIAPGLAVLQPRTTTVVLKSMGLGIIQLCGALIAIVLVIYTIPTEIERRTIYTILAKPVQRYQFVLGKFLGSALSLFVMMALMGASFIFVYWLQQRGSDPALMMNIRNLTKGVTLFYIQVLLLAAVAMMFSTFIAPLVNFFITSGLYLLGNLLNPFFDSIKDNQAASSGARFAASIVHYVLPNFANYNIQNPIINPEQTLTNDALYMNQIIMYGVIYIAILLVISVLIFDRREM